MVTNLDLIVICLISFISNVRWYVESTQEMGGMTRKLMWGFIGSNAFFDVLFLILAFTYGQSHVWFQWFCAIGWVLNVLTVMGYRYKGIYLGRKFGTYIIVP